MRTSPHRYAEYDSIILRGDSKWTGDGDMLLFDINKSNENERNYIIDGDQGYQTDEWDYIKGDFENRIDRLIVAQGTKYWRWT
jgi:hypothetical protein